MPCASKATKLSLALRYGASLSCTAIEISCGMEGDVVMVRLMTSYVFGAFLVPLFTHGDTGTEGGLNVRVPENSQTRSLEEANYEKKDSIPPSAMSEPLFIT